MATSTTRLREAPAPTVIPIQTINGTLTPPAQQKLGEGQFVKWDAEGRPFLIVFSGDSPFDLAFTATERSDALQAVKRGIFHYSVAVHDGGRVTMIAGCPELQVGD
jgi:hypothetical protein